MARMIVSKDDVAKAAVLQRGQVPGALTGGPPAQPTKLLEEDKYLNRLLKYIPSEIIGVYVALEASLAPQRPIPILVDWLMFATFLALTYLYLWRVQRVTKQLQLFISCVAFAIWVYALGGQPFQALHWYQAYVATAILPLFTLLAGIVEV